MGCHNGVGLTGGLLVEPIDSRLSATVTRRPVRLDCEWPFCPNRLVAVCWL